MLNTGSSHIPGDLSKLVLAKIILIERGGGKIKFRGAEGGCGYSRKIFQKKNAAISGFEVKKHHFLIGMACAQ